MGWWHRQKKFKESLEEITVLVRLTQKTASVGSLTKPETGLIHFGTSFVSRNVSMGDGHFSDEEKLEVLFELGNTKLIAGALTIKSVKERDDLLEGLPEMIGLIYGTRKALVFEHRLPLTEALTCDCKTIRELAAKGYRRLKTKGS